MPTLLRLLRAEVQAHDRAPPIQTPRQREREARILHLGELLLARFGRQNISFSKFAQALHLTRDALRWHFADLDDLLGVLIRQHLRTLTGIIGDIPRATPDCAAKRRAAYLAATRTALGSFTTAHLLLVRDRSLLPEDLLDTIQATYRELGSILAGPTRQPHAEQILALLDSPDLATADIEHKIAALPETAIAPPAQPRPTPKPAAKSPRPFTWNAEPPPPNIPFTLPPDKLAGLLQFAQPRSKAALKTSTSPPPATKRFGT